ncbi:MAG: alpha/beta hydrolase [Rhodoferax sp.]|jgi:acetyl esterase|nr:alpha/beta hydrolase [Rhodoferax sp.]
MPLHPVIADALAAAAGQPSYDRLPLAEARAQAMQPYLRSNAPAVPVASVRDTTLPGPGGQSIPVRVYLPHGAGPFPVTVFLHGSGFVLLGLDSHDRLCRQLCAGAECAVVSVDYRLAPEHRFPAASDDCLAAVRWVRRNAQALSIDPERIALAGDSAGACLSAVTCARLCDAGEPQVCAQLLFYPVTNYPLPLPDSYGQFSEGYGLTAAGMHWFWDQYLRGPQDRSHPWASPLRAASLAGLPPTYVAVAEFDVLRDEGEAYARRLKGEGIPVLAHRAAGMNHGFLKYSGRIAEVDQEIREACAWLHTVLEARRQRQEPTPSPASKPGNSHA